MRLNDAKESPRYKLAIKLRQSGNTYREIGKMLGVTRGRAWQIVNADRYREIWRESKYGRSGEDR